jgi:ADP-ribose pyrophosphatase
MEIHSISDLTPRILARSSYRVSPWIEVIAKTVAFPNMPHPEIYHALHQADYVAVLGITPDNKIPLVRQFRPALERYTLELPAGLVESGQSPGDAAIRELHEETGFSTASKLVDLGCLAPDSGRLENRMWCFYAALGPSPLPSWAPEAGVTPALLSKDDLRAAILAGEFDHALHIAVIGLALTAGHFAWN